MATLSANDIATILDDSARASSWLSEIGVKDARRAEENLKRIAESGVPLDLLAGICQTLSLEQANISDIDMAINNLERFVASARSPLSLAALFDRDKQSLPVLLQILSTSQHLSDLLIRQPEVYDLLRMSEGTPVSRGVLVDELLNEMAIAGGNEAKSTELMRRFKLRETARIIYGDIIRGQRLETVTRQISHVADTICEAAVFAARQQLLPLFGQPRHPDGRLAEFVVVALGKLGGCELNYSSDIDLILFYSDDGHTDGKRPITNAEYFDNLARRFVKMMTTSTEFGACYRVDLRLRPNGSQGPIVISRDAALRYYDLHGRTWERQAFVKARPIAGNRGLGEDILGKLATWTYRRYLGQADIAGIKTLKRKIEKRTADGGTEYLNVKSGHGGIRDIEFVIQFLQLLNGGELETIRTGNTLEAIVRLEEVGCLTMQERTILEENYAFLRKIEHRLQIMFDMQTHTLPTGDDEMTKLAIRMGYGGAESDEGSADTPPLDQFKNDLKEKSELNRKILDHLLHDAFPASDTTSPTIDLVLDPNPGREAINETLAPYNFTNVAAAYENLSDLSHEKIPFLSTRRCRHFLAAIASKLLSEIAATPDPDQTLLNLSTVSDSLGGKGALWELFSVSDASMKLYVRLCASSPYLSSILTTNPGMIDELMDSLVRNRLPTPEEIFSSLRELTASAEDIDPILHSFKHSMHLLVGVRDILDKDDIKATTETLSAIAEACLQQVAIHEYRNLVLKYGIPKIGPDHVRPTFNHSGEAASSAESRQSDLTGIHPVGIAIADPPEDTCEFVILGLGKLGGSEPNYHSDLDVVFLYECEGQTWVPAELRGNDSVQTTSNQHFFSELGQRIIRRLTRITGLGRLYEMDPRLRPTGKSGALAVSLDEFRRYFSNGSGQLWERQALCKARPVFGSAAARAETMEAVQHILCNPPWQSEFASQIYDMRLQMEKTAKPDNLKRGSGGTVDVEFVVQMLQLRHVEEHPEIVVPGTLNAIAKLENLDMLSSDDADCLTQSYRYLRRVESRLRLMNTTARHDLPEAKLDLERLAYLLRTESVSLSSECSDHRRRNRELLSSVSKN